MSAAEITKWNASGSNKGEENEWEIKVSTCSVICGSRGFVFSMDHIRCFSQVRFNETPLAQIKEKKDDMG